MKSEYPYSPLTNGKKNEAPAVPSRFIDEKISDETGAETQADSAMKPAELSNPFWK